MNCNCLIRKNSPELVDELEKLGYVNWTVCPEDAGILVTMVNFKTVSYSLPDKEEPTLVGIESEDDFEDYLDDEYNTIDCDESETLFLAIAALRDDTDKNQWFIYDYDDNEPETCDKMVLCTSDNWEDDFSSWNSNDDLHSYMFRKATVEELVDYFSIS